MGDKFSKIRYDGNEEIIETTIKDGTGRTLGKWVCMKSDYPKVVIIVKQKYGIKMYIKENAGDRDLDWAK